MSSEVFVDTNVLVYRHDATEPDKNAQARRWVDYLWRHRRGRLSVQVLQELYATLTRKLTPGLEPATAREIVRPYFAWRPVPMTSQLVELAWQIEAGGRISWWDALIVAASKHSGCVYLLTEDLGDDGLYGDVRVVSPFRVSPEELESTDLS